MEVSPTRIHPPRARPERTGLGGLVRAHHGPRDHGLVERGDGGSGALPVLLLVFLSTFPGVIPCLLMRGAQPALHVANAVAVAKVFVAGYAYGRITHHRRWPVGAQWCCPASRWWRSRSRWAVDLGARCEP